MIYGDLRRHPPGWRNVLAYVFWLGLYLAGLIGCVLAHNAALARIGL